jgi:hypothetical protein
VPEGSGGLLPALHLWRRLLLSGPVRFGEVYFLGTAPLIDQEVLLDVLVGTHDVTETQFYFAPDTGQLVALEMFPDDNVDPCEIAFADYREVGSGRKLPFRLIVKHGDRVVGEIQLDNIELPSGLATEGTEDTE